jgi:hypothetical protein
MEWRGARCCCCAAPMPTRWLRSASMGTPWGAGAGCPSFVWHTDGSACGRVQTPVQLNNTASSSQSSQGSGLPEVAVPGIMPARCECPHGFHRRRRRRRRLRSSGGMSSTTGQTISASEGAFFRGSESEGESSLPRKKRALEGGAASDGQVSGLGSGTSAVDAQVVGALAIQGD